MRILKANFLMKRAIILMAPFLFIACEKDNGEIGLDQVIGGLPDNLIDTSLSVLSFTQSVDSVLVAVNYDSQRQIGGYTGSRLAGARIDADFGRAEAGFVSQMILNQVNPDFGSNPVVDSVKLYLNFSGSYGDTTRSMSLEVYELAQDLDRDTSYYSSFKPVDGLKIGEKLNFMPRPNSAITVDDTVEITPTLVLDMDKAYFQQKFADVGNGAFPSLATNEDFVQYFKGIHVKAASEDGSILYFNLNSVNSKLLIYYSNDSGDDRIALNFAQDRSTVPMSFSIFSQNYSSYPTVFNLASQDSVNGEMTTYVQSMGGVATVLKFPDFEDLNSQDDIVINRAFIEIPIQRGVSSGPAPSGNLQLRKMTSDGPGSLIDDFIFGQAGGDGKLRVGELRSNKYVFEVTQHLFDCYMFFRSHEQQNETFAACAQQLAPNSSGRFCFLIDVIH
ncbi:MAG TPA: hypothetical protein DCG19_03085 [Cryomorphaceae bacterium]|nr:hypothetical protein [Cryomorphaceae bacterium]